ncbi:hypothetical protein [Solibacillus sp. CAU 1738]|uniref:hypothetical protein n=1 Tax=Solibacillus sp. CAU 1738 TaxID=3140363 RepID=UPI003261549C
MNYRWLEQITIGDKVVAITKSNRKVHKTYDVLTVTQVNTFGRITLNNGVVIDKNGRERGKGSALGTPRTTYHEFTPVMQQEIETASKVIAVEHLIHEVDGIDLAKQSIGSLESIELSLLHILNHVRRTS